MPRGRPQLLRLAVLTGLVMNVAACAASDSARYVQFRMAQAGLSERATEALDAGLIDVATAKRILAISEAVSARSKKYREALDAGAPRRLTREILAVMERLLNRAEIFLPAPEILE